MKRKKEKNFNFKKGEKSKMSTMINLKRKKINKNEFKKFKKGKDYRKIKKDNGKEC